MTIPNQTHVQTATSAETFAAVYRFFRGRRPETTKIVPKRGKFVRVAGRAVLFPQNAGGDERDAQGLEGQAARPAVTSAGRRDQAADR